MVKRKIRKQKRNGMNLWMKILVGALLILIVLIGLFGMNGGSEEGDGLASIGRFFDLSFLFGAGVNIYGDCDEGYQLNSEGDCVKICSSDLECDDGVECTIDSCTTEGCENVETSSCDGSGGDDGGSDDGGIGGDEPIKETCETLADCPAGYLICLNGECLYDIVVEDISFLPCNDFNACTEDVCLVDECTENSKENKECKSILLPNCVDNLGGRCDVKYTVKDGKGEDSLYNVVCLDNPDAVEVDGQFETEVGGCSDSATTSPVSNSFEDVGNIEDIVGWNSESSGDNNLIIEDISSKGACIECIIKGSIGIGLATNQAGEGYKIVDRGNGRWEAVRIDGKTVPVPDKSRITVSSRKSQCLMGLLFPNRGGSMIQILRKGCA